MKIKYYQRFYNPKNLSNAPQHFYFGATSLKKHHIDVSFLGDSSLANRIYRGIKIAFLLIFSMQSYDLLYGSTANGLEVIVLLKSLGLYKKPIVVWQHRALKHTRNKWLKKILRFYYKGFDQMFMFCPQHVKESVLAGVMPESKLKVVKWGPDLNYYDHIIEDEPLDDDPGHEHYFCSTGRENRDFPTLIEAFESLPDDVLKIYTTKQHGGIDNEKILLNRGNLNSNIHISIIGVSSSNNTFLAKEVLNCFCTIICCYKHNYTVGLTSLFEAMALGKPVIMSDNPYFPFDVEKENIGIKVEYGSANAWAKAIKYLSENRQKAKEMGYNARKLAEKEYNLDLFASEVADTLKSIAKK